MQWLYTLYPIRLLIAVCAWLAIVMVTIQPLIITVHALPTVEEFNARPGNVMSDRDFYSLPFSFSSAEQIQQYLVGQRSLLASLVVPVSFELDSAVINEGAFSLKPEIYKPSRTVVPHINKTMRASDVIWMLTRTNMSNSCDLYLVSGVYRAGDMCYDTSAIPINPAFLLAMIQKESGLVYGTNSRLDPNSDQARFLIDRAVGYYCFDAPRASSCYDENPDWKYFKGFFRQLYYAVRLLRIREQTCKTGGSYAFRNSRGIHQVGNTVQVGDFDANGNLIWVPVLLENGISCALYIYTPYISSQRTLLRVMREIGADRNFVETKGLSPDYTPVLLVPFEQPVENKNMP